MARLALPSAPEQWTPAKLWALLVAAIITVLALVAGGVWSLVSVFNDGGSDHTSPASPAVADGGTPEDQLAAQALPTAPDSAAQPAPATTEVGRSIVVPLSTRQGAAYVPSGFPHSAEGAMAQMIAIDTAALEGGSVPRAQQVIAAWAAPGGPTPASWSGVSAVAQLVSGQTDIEVRVSAPMGVIKGTVGDDYVVPCVDFVLTTTVNGPGGPRTIRTAAADCQRMTWEGHRWVVAAGAEPAVPPSIWPGTQAALDAGYAWLTTEKETSK